MLREVRKVAIIGSGNVAYHLGMALKRSQNELQGIYARNAVTGERLAFESGCEYFQDLTAIPDDVEVIILAVKDDAIAQVVAQIFYPGRLVVHTSGTVRMEMLEVASDRVGVFYPLQTLHRSNSVNLKDVPICVEANANWGEGMLMELAASISDSVHLVNSEQRRTMHLAAVIACNFSNHLYALSQDILEKDGLHLSILKPLILQTAGNIKKGNPKQLQTGPAVRGDDEVISRHLKMLEKNHSDLKPLYEILTQSISSYSNS